MDSRRRRPFEDLASKNTMQVSQQCRRLSVTTFPDTVGVDGCEVITARPRQTRTGFPSTLLASSRTRFVAMAAGCHGCWSLSIGRCYTSTGTRGARCCRS